MEQGRLKVNALFVVPPAAAGAARVDWGGGRRWVFELPCENGGSGEGLSRSEHVVTGTTSCSSEEGKVQWDGDGFS